MGFATGELIGVTSATQMPNIPCKYVNFKALAANTGKVYISGNHAVVSAQAATTTQTGFQLSVGDETGFLNASSLAGDLDTVGNWIFQAYIEMPSGKWKSDTQTFVVHPNL